VGGKLTRNFLFGVIAPMSLRTRLNLLITSLLLLVMLIGTLMLLQNAREQVQAEVESVSIMAAQLVNPVTSLFARMSVPNWTHTMGISGIEHLRHIRISFYNKDGVLIYSKANTNKEGIEDSPPAWFEDLMTRNLTPVKLERELLFNGIIEGKVVIEADPSYEVAEVWNDTIGLFGLVVLFFVSVNILVFWAVGHALKPVGRILEALNELEKGNLDARLPAFELKELSSISQKFNVMAETLQASITRNHRLSQQLIYLQEEERKSLARDLHDELGQCLTAIMADGTALLRLSESKLPEGKASAEAIVGVTQHVMGLLRAMLQRLRPDVLDGLGLLPAVEELVANWRQRNRGVTLTTQYSDDLDNLNDALRITAYRVVQECLTNISRHADAHRVTLQLERETGAYGNQLVIVVEDDGKGFYPERTEGFGLSGMRERIQGLSGTFEVKSTIGQGTRIRVCIPVQEENL
jgi:two-component system sensor histidine kinase UhpB